MSKICIIQAIKSILEENNLTTNDLFENKIISKDTFYKYKNRYPSLPTLIKIVNHLGVSVDYLFDLSDKNIFREYSSDQTAFYNKLKRMLNLQNISQRKLCEDLGYSRANISRWKNGANPSVETIIEITQYLKCSTDDLLTCD